MEVQDWKPQSNDPQNQPDPYCGNNFYKQEQLHFQNTFDKSLEQIEDDHIITDSHVSDKIRYALTALWTVIKQPPNTSPLPNFRPPLDFTICQISLPDGEIILQLQSFQRKNTKFLPISTNLQMKNKSWIALFPDGFQTISHWGPPRYKFIDKQTQEKLDCQQCKQFWITDYPLTFK